MGTNSIFSFLRNRHGGSGSKKTQSVSRPFSGRFIEASYGRDATVLFCGSRTEEERKAAVTHLKTAIAAAERQHQAVRKVGRKSDELGTAAPQEEDGDDDYDDDVKFWASCPGTPDCGDWCDGSGVDIFAIGSSSSDSDSDSDSGLGLGDRSPPGDAQVDMVAAWVAAQCSLVEEEGYDGGTPEWYLSVEKLSQGRGTDTLDAMMAEGKSLDEAVAMAAAAAPRPRYSMAYSDGELLQESKLHLGDPGADLEEFEWYSRRVHSTDGGRRAGRRCLGYYADRARTIPIGGAFLA
jgi:hypothetical protein